ncbi:Triphosphate tunel metalloenzyme 3 [Bienertia sinuspersici]
MEVEVKLRLSNSTAHQSVSSVLSPFLQQTHFQHNIFFDGAASELSSCRAVLRLRFYGEDPQTAERCVLSLKAKAVLENGVSRVEEDEEDLDPFLGREIWANPNLIRSTESRVLKRVREEFNVKEESGYVCLGGFKNVRGVYGWKGLKLELDETLFDFGTLYEIECESSEPDKAKEMIEELLKDNGISYSCSTLSKFAIFRSGELPLSLVKLACYRTSRVAVWLLQPMLLSVQKAFTKSLMCSSPFFKKRKTARNS